MPEIKRTGTPNAGFGTFVCNVVTCLQIAGLTIPQKFDMWHKNGVQLSRSLLRSSTIPKKALYLLGNNTLCAPALHASLQMAEFFGTTAVAHKLEEFCHSPIFGIKKSHHILILGQNEKFLSSKIERLGLRISYIELHNPDP